MGLLLFISSPISQAQESPPQLAFLSAEGFGAYAKGGRGGEIYHVTNLRDDGQPGSLRHAVEQEGPRTIVFDISGTIQLQSTLRVENPFITIAGQTAPGDGICLRDDALIIETHDVIVRYIRVRLGDQGDTGDALSINEGHNIIVDHCSASWSTDEVLSTSTGDPTLTNVTVQWCFITEGLNPENHSFGSLIRGTGGAKYSYHHNLYAHNRNRNPRPGNYDDNPHDEDPEGLLLDFRNNVIYNWAGSYAGYNADEVSITKLNYINNFLIPGPDSKNNGIAYRTGSPYNKAYFAGNIYNYQEPSNRWNVVDFDDDWNGEQAAAYKQDQPFEIGSIKQEDAWTAYHKVIGTAGASLHCRDETDERIINNLQRKTGTIIDSQQEVGGWPQLDSTPAPKDTDRDGMPDAWENAHGLNPQDANDRNDDMDEDGYTNLEEYLNELCQEWNSQLDRREVNGVQEAVKMH